VSTSRFACATSSAATIVARGSAWVTEGQLDRLFAQPPQMPDLPFAIRRVTL